MRTPPQSPRLPSMNSASTLEKTIAQKKFIWLSITLATFCAIVAGGWLWNSRMTDRDLRVQPHRGDLVEAVYGLGTVTSERVFRLKIGITATVQNLYAIEGQEVKAGDPLIRIDEPAPFRAPFDGTVTSIPFKPGETVYPQIPLLTLMDLKRVYVVVSIEQDGALRVKKGQAVRLAFESLRGQKFDGKVRTIFPNEGQFFVHVDVESLPPEILPGMTADVAIEIDRRKNVLLVPVAAISNGKLRVMKGTRVKKIDVKVGTVDGEWAEVTSGELTTDDEVLVRRK